jgi:thymidylate synthase (FAD)
LEHVIFQWLIEAPIFVWREFMRHRIASYNEESGRYKQLDPVFYIPNEDRRLVQVGKASKYDLIEGDPDMLDYVQDSLS